MAVDRREDVWVRWMTIAMAATATAALEQAMLEPGHSRLVAPAWTAGLLVAPAIVAGRFLARRRDPDDGRAIADRTEVAGLLALFAMPMAGEAVRLLTTGRCPPAELALLASLRNLGPGLSAMAHRPACARLAALVGLFLVIVASPLGGDAGIAVTLPVAGFAMAGTTWLMLIYWRGIGLGSGPRRLPISATAWVLTVVGVVAAVAAVGPSRAASALAGLVPTSGGTEWSDPDARSGVGDGDNEVAASEHPQSVGFTQSDVYLETDRPSLFDAFNESFGEPLRPKKQDKMIALGLQDVREQKERPAENLRAGREFAAVRRKPEANARRPGEREAEALVYIKGPTPLHLPLTAFCLFDGATWREEPACNQHFPAELEPDGGWLRMFAPASPYLVGMVAHRIKIGALESSPIPMPPHPARFRIGGVNRLDFFGWAQLGIVRMTDRTVPAGMVVEAESFTVDPEGLRAQAFPPHPDSPENPHASFLGAYAIDPAVAALARAWTARVPAGWRQVEAVVDRLRDGYQHDRSATSPPGCTDVVAEFLLRGRRGPDYLFASSAAVLLRSLGYPTRLVGGLYAAPGRYDPRTGHTPVTADDAHIWVEVQLPGGRWIAVEPTPGYELMPPSLSWARRIAAAAAAALGWARANAVGLIAAAAMLGGLALRRRDVMDRLATLAVRLAPGDDPRRCVLRSLGLIERRARWAGRPRPPGRTLSRWYLPVAGRAPGEPRAALEGLVRLADWAAHAPNRTTLGDDDDIRRTCRSAVRTWTLARFRRVSPAPRTEVA